MDARVDEPARGTMLAERVIAALRLDLRVYQEVSADSAATRQAFIVVLLSGASNGVGLAQHLGSAALSAGVASAVVGWFLWALVILVIARLLGHRRQGRSLLRPLG